MRNIEKMLGEALGDPHEVLKSRAVIHNAFLFLNSSARLVRWKFPPYFDPGNNLVADIFVANLV